MCEKLVRELQSCPDAEYGCSRCEFQMTLNCRERLMKKASDAIEELSKRIDRAVELYNRGVERSAMYEALVGIAPEPPKEES